MSSSVCSLLYLTPSLNALNPIPYSFRIFFIFKTNGLVLNKIDLRRLVDMPCFAQISG
jgi:hypothetical protein